MSQELASQWTGYFSFTNQLGQEITSGIAKHWTTDFGIQSIDLSGLADGQTSLSKAFTTGTSNKDRWAFTATVSGDKTYSVNEKDCDFDTGDSGLTANLQAIIAHGKGNFYIIMPYSSNCSTSF